MKPLFITVIFLLALPRFSAAQTTTRSSINAGQQRYAEKALKDNKKFFFFIASSVTNRGSSTLKKQYREAVQRDFLSRLLFMQFRFNKSLEESIKAQRLLITIYKSVITNDNRQTKSLLNSLAPQVIRDRNFKTRLYLRLGYRSAAESLIIKVKADNFREKLYSMRLYQYVRAMKKIKFSRRYAVILKLELARPPEDRIHSLNTKFIPLLEKLKKLKSEKDTYISIHYDNYYITKNGTTLYDEVWEKPSLEELPEYKDYRSTH